MEVSVAILTILLGCSVGFSAFLYRELNLLKKDFDDLDKDTIEIAKLIEAVVTRLVELERNVETIYHDSDDDDDLLH